MNKQHNPHSYNLNTKINSIVWKWFGIQIGILLPFHIIIYITWNYLSISPQTKTLSWDRVLHILNTGPNFPFTDFEWIGWYALISICFIHILQWALSLYYYHRFFTYISLNFKHPNTFKSYGIKRQILFIIPVLLLFFSEGTFYNYINLASMNRYLIYAVTDNCFIFILWASLTNLYLHFTNLSVIPYSKKSTFAMPINENEAKRNMIYRYTPISCFSIFFILIFSRTTFFLKSVILDQSVPIYSQIPWIIAPVLVMSVFCIAFFYITKKQEQNNISAIYNKIIDLSRIHEGANLSKVLSDTDLLSLVEYHLNIFMKKFNEQVSRSIELNEQIMADNQKISERFNTIINHTTTDQKEIIPTIEQSKKISITIENLFLAVQDKNTTINNSLEFIQKVSGSISQVINSFRKIQQLSNYNSQSGTILSTQIQEAQKKGNELSQRMTKITEQIQKAGEESQYIDEILFSIQDIAEQTNMLSINAAIEAAHAGKDGKGFAIVANSVRNLAGESSIAVQKISQKLVDIQNLIQETVASTQETYLSTQEYQESIDNSYSTIAYLSDQFKNLTSYTLKADSLSHSQGTTTKNFTNQIYQIETFFKELMESIKNQESSFRNLIRVSSELENNLSHVISLSDSIYSSIDKIQETTESYQRVTKNIKDNEDSSSHQSNNI